jgi:hypothetical protein
MPRRAQIARSVDRTPCQSKALPALQKPVLETAAPVDSVLIASKSSVKGI